MSTITTTLQTLLLWFPFGTFLAHSPYGIVYGALIFDAFSCVIMFISRIVFKSYFPSLYRKCIFLICAGGTAFGVMICYLVVTVKTIPLGYSILPNPDLSYLLPVYYLMIIIASVFFAIYLIDFILRLVHHIVGRRKAAGSAK